VNRAIRGPPNQGRVPLGWRTDLRATAEYAVVLFAIAQQPASAVLQLTYGYDDRFRAGLPTSTFGVLRAPRAHRLQPVEPLLLRPRRKD
jgi:hypothetical protein